MLCFILLALAIGVVAAAVSGTMLERSLTLQMEVASCAACGYSLHGLSAAAPCPECGGRQRRRVDVTPRHEERWRYVWICAAGPLVAGLQTMTFSGGTLGSWLATSIGPTLLLLALWALFMLGAPVLSSRRAWILFAAAFVPAIAAMMIMGLSAAAAPQKHTGDIISLAFTLWFGAPLVGFTIGTWSLALAAYVLRYV